MALPRWLYILLKGKEPPIPARTAEQKLADEIAAIGRMAKARTPATIERTVPSPTPPKRAERARIRPGTFGASARFTYTNHKGEVTTREIRNWVSEADYVTGDCQLKGVELTFNKRRIDNWDPS